MEDSKLEAGVLGSILSDSEALDRCLNYGAKPEWFTGKNQRLFKSLSGMHLADEAVDLLTVGDKLNGVGCGLDYLTDLVDQVETSAFVVSYLEGVERDYKRRKIKEVAQKALRSDDDPEKVASELSEALTSIISTEIEKTTADCMDDNILVMDNACDGVVAGLPLPWERFSNHTGGIMRGSVCPVVGRDGKGKSGTVAQILDYWAGRDIPCLAFSFEDVARRTLLRMGGCREWYSAMTAETGRALFNDRWEKITQHEREELRRKMLKYKAFIDEKPFWIIDTPMTVEEVCYQIKHHHRVHGIQGVTIDGFKDIVHSVGESETAREKHIAKALFKVAKECNIALPVVSHVHDVPDDMPLSKRNLMGSKVQTQGARQVVIFQDAGVEGVDGETTFQLSMTKSNYGGGGSVLLRRDDSVFHYTEMT